MKKSFVIAIDGASSTGKSTLAKGLAKALDFVYVDSGAMYRGVTLYAQQNQWLTTSHFNQKQLIDHLQEVQLSFHDNKLVLNGVDVSTQIRSMAVSNGVSQVAAVSEVRLFLVAQQRAIANKTHVVMDGRDIGTIVFPNADLKLFLVADPEIRAQRRFDELKEQEAITFNQVLENITKRDLLDSTRVDSPLVQAKDAIVLDASQYTVQEMLQMALEWVKKRF